MGIPIAKRNVQYSQLYANDKNRFDEARGELNLILDEPALEGLPLLIYCNKQDLSDAMRPSEIEQKLDLADRSRNVIIVGCTAYTGEGIHKGLSLLAQMLGKDSKAETNNNSNVLNQDAALLVAQLQRLGPSKVNLHP